jgi:hypothetical protein
MTIMLASLLAGEVAVNLNTALAQTLLTLLIQYEAPAAFMNVLANKSIRLMAA